MLVPAITRKEEIIRAFQSKYYTEDLMFNSGWIGFETINIMDYDNGVTEQWAVIDDEELIGYIAFSYSCHDRRASSFCIMNFDKGNPTFGRDLYKVLNKIIKEYKPHVMEWHMVSGNPVERHYDSFCKRYNGNKYILRDRIMDKKGNWHDDVLYEIIFEENKH